MNSVSASGIAGSVLNKDFPPSQYPAYVNPVPVGSTPAMTLRPLNGANDQWSAGPLDKAVERASTLLRRGEIVAVGTPAGFQFICDAANAAAVAKLRARTRRETRPFTLMARDIDVIRRYCIVSREEARALNSLQSQIVVVSLRYPEALPKEIAPGLATIGFQLPSAAPFVSLLEQLDQPLVVVNGDSPDQIASYLLSHDPGAGNRTDTMLARAPAFARPKVIRFMDGEPRVLRQGDARSPFELPRGLEHAPDLLALGGDRDATFCLVKDARAILSPCQGNLDRPAAFDAYREAIARSRDHYDHAPEAIVADLHPEYMSSKLARTMRPPLQWVQHHHAHIASCLCENSYPLDAPRVLGIALDGVGWGSDGTFWGGEFLLANYHGFRRLAALKPVAMPGEARSMREPWRNLYAHIAGSMGWAAFEAGFAALDSHTMLTAMPHRTLGAMIARDIDAPRTSSCGRLFDAVAAALGVSVARQNYEREAAARLEAMADRVRDGSASYPFTLSRGVLRLLDPAPMWGALFRDLAAGTPAPTVAARFHDSFARALANTAAELSQTDEFRTVALSGDCFENRLLFEQTARHLTAAGFVVLTPSRVPSNDAGIALGQAAVAAARLLPRHLSAHADRSARSCR